MAKGSKKIVIQPNVENELMLRVNGDVSAADGRELSGRLNAVIAYWNTVLGNNTSSDPEAKLSAETGEPFPSDVARGLNDEPFKGGKDC